MRAARRSSLDVPVRLPRIEPQDVRLSEKRTQLAKTGDFDG
jgi:hypothetical protein